MKILKKIQNAVFERPLLLAFPEALHNNSPENAFYNEDANRLVIQISADLFYIGPIIQDSIAMPIIFLKTWLLGTT